MKKKLLFLYCIFSFLVFAEDYKSICQKLSKYSSLKDGISFLEKNIPSVTNGGDLKKLYTLLADMEQSDGNYNKALKHFILALDFETHLDADLRIKSTKCALYLGKSDLIEGFLSPVLLSSKDETKVARAKFYSICANLTEADSLDEIRQNVSILKSYLNLKNMATVKKDVLFLLWWLTNEDTYRKELKLNYPDSLEKKIAFSEIRLLKENPFWVFIPRLTLLDELKIKETNLTNQTKIPVRQKKYYQVGFFESKKNADTLVQKLFCEGFHGEIFTERRESGTLYYIVAVSDEYDSKISEKLKQKGFSNYPAKNLK